MKIHKLFLRSKNPPIGKEVLLKYGEGKWTVAIGEIVWLLDIPTNPTEKRDTA